MITLLARMAARNLTRHLRRSIITAAAISLGLALLIISSGLGDGAHNTMVEAGVGMMAGHVVVQGKGYQELRETRITVDNATEAIHTLRHLRPDAVVVPRVFLRGLLTSPRSAMGIAVHAVQPDLEARVSGLHERIIRGRNLQGDDDILIGQTLSETLDVQLGDRVVFMTQSGSEMESQLFRVRGIFRTGAEEIDGFMAFVPLIAGQKLLEDPDSVSQIALHFPTAEQVEQTAQQVRRALDRPDVEVLTWMEAMPELYEFIVFDDAGMYVFILIIALIVALGILNTVLMSTLERTHEFGVMLALGMKGSALGTMVLFEALILGVCAALAGVGLGLLLNWPLAAVGLDYGKLMGDSVAVAGVSLDTVIESELSAVKVALFALLTVVMTVLAAVYPVFNVLRLRPVQAMQGH